MLCGAAGIGGGAVYVPLFNALLFFSIKASTALSQATITSSSLMSLVYFFFQSHPIDKSLPLIDYDCALLFAPTLLMGTSFGVLLNAILPAWLITFLLILLFSLLSAKTLLSAVSLYKRETVALKEGESEVHRPLLGGGGGGGGGASLSDGRDLPSLGGTLEQRDLPLQDGELESHRVSFHIPWVKAGSLVVMWTAMAGFQISKDRYKCTWPYWILLIIQIILVVLATYVVIAYVIKPNDRQEDRSSLNSTSECVALTLFSAVAGLIGGMFGLGGGAFIVPWLLHLKFLPQVAAATSNLVVLFSASTAMICFGIEGILNWQYAAVYGIDAAFFAMIGMVVISKLVKNGRSSPIVFIVSLILGCGTILTIAFAGRDAIEGLVEHKDIGFRVLCI